MKKNNFKSLIILMVLSVLLFSNLAVAMPDEFGRGLNNPKGEITLEVNDVGFIGSLMSSIGLFSISGLRESLGYFNSEIVSITTREKLFKNCDDAYVTVEFYSAPKTSQTSGTYQGGANEPLGSLNANVYKELNVNYHLPSNAKALSPTWSVSSYIYCSDNTDPASQYSSVTESDFPMRGLPVDPSDCDSDCFTGQKVCLTKYGYANRYVGTCGNYDSDNCLEFPTSDNDLIDCGRIGGCEDGQCIYDDDDDDDDECTINADCLFDEECNVNNVCVDLNCGTGYHAVNHICVIDIVDEECTAGQTKCVGTTYYECSNNNWVSQGKIIGKCGYIEDGEKPNFELEFVSVPVESKADDEISVEVKITNLGASGSMRVETGIYYDKTLDDWFEGSGLFAIAGATIINNCEPVEKNIQTKQITLGAGASGTETFTFKIPTICSISGALDKTSKLDIYSGAMEKCFNTGEATGITDAIRQNIKIESKFGLSCGTCSDGLQNGDETDTDCGGKDCLPCRESYRCEKKSDCETDLACTNGICTLGSGDTNDCAKPISHFTKDTSLFELGRVIPSCSESFTKKEFKTATDNEIFSSLCDENRNCKQRSGYEVDCVKQTVANVEVPTSGIVSSLLDFVFDLEEPGVCLATEENGDFDLSFFTEDSLIPGIANGIIFLAVLLILMVIGGRKK